MSNFHMIFSLNKSTVINLQLKPQNENRKFKIKLDDSTSVITKA